ncbi:hypothetical protein RM572_11290 [Streptomyces sp. DSM 42041]|uniref:Integral membrane protein n=1 Tax=Streptomyces hazeniae TaxID=3075538 RepID=A0ABU2NQU9_9ACTN|nr:hypothetical protein [Streptomyces sp. DSM 42041]MDT0379351.1 hypothetical protein [Streptomyces sp. DSM 42041]
MRFATLVLLLGAFLVPAPAAHAAAPATAHGSVSAQGPATAPGTAATRQDTGVRAAASGGRSRGGYRGTGGTGSDYSDGGRMAAWEIWLSVGILCALVVWWVVSVRRRKNRGRGSD